MHQVRSLILVQYPSVTNCAMFASLNSICCFAAIVSITCFFHIEHLPTSNLFYDVNGLTPQSLNPFLAGTSELVVDTFPLPPIEIERHFGITRGHIHHVDNSFGYSDRVPYATPLSALYSCSAGTHPAGSVIGCAGHNCATRVARDLGISANWFTPVL